MAMIVTSLWAISTGRRTIGGLRPAGKKVLYRRVEGSSRQIPRRAA